MIGFITVEQICNSMSEILYKRWSGSDIFTDDEGIDHVMDEIEGVDYWIAPHLSGRMTAKIIWTQFDIDLPQPTNDQ